jgi:hypothetical protein
MKISERLAGPATLTAAFALNALLNHTAPGAWLEHIPGFYPVVFFIGVGALLPGLVLGDAVRREPAMARSLGVVLGWRDAIAVIAALAIGMGLAASPLSPILAQPGGVARVLTLFVQLLVASTAEVALFLGMVWMSLRAWRLRDDWLGRLALVVVASLIFALFHFTYPAPWNTLGTAATVGLVWVGVSMLFALGHSLPSAVLFNNIMATVGFATRDLTLPLSPSISLVLAIGAAGAFIIAFSWARHGRMAHA